MKYKSNTLTPSAYGNTTGWSANAGTTLTAVQSNDGDTTYIHTSTANTVHLYEFVNIALDTDLMIMGVEVFAVYKGGEIQLIVDRNSQADGLQYSYYPRYKNFAATTEYTEASIFLSNQQFDTLLLDSTAWGTTGTLEVGMYGFGVKSKQSVDTRVTHFGVRYYVRSKADIDTIIATGEYQSFQFMEIEGIRHVPMSDSLNDVCGDYYLGYDLIPIPHSMKLVDIVDSGKINDSTGMIDMPGCTVELIDSDIVSIEGVDNYYKNGFYSWLLSFGDLTNFNSDYMCDSMSDPIYNTIKGVNPKDTVDGYGEAFTTESDMTNTFGTANTCDSFLYIDRELVWYGGITYPTGDEDVGKNKTHYSSLARGVAGSTDSPHIINKYTGVYPLVTDHPTSWSNRWFKIWTVILDPETGFPLPLNCAFARTYSWGNHSQLLGTNDLIYSITGGPFVNRLNGSIYNSGGAKTKHLALGNINKAIVTYSQTGGSVRHGEANLTANYYSSVSGLCNDLTSELVGGSSVWGNNHWSVGVKNSGAGGGVIEHYADISSNQVDVKLELTEGVSEILGFDGKAGSKTATTVEDSASGTQRRWQWLGNESAKQVYVFWGTDRVFIDSDDTSDWGTLGVVDYIGPGRIYVDIQITSDNGECFFRVTGARATDSSLGTYYPVIPGLFPEFANKDGDHESVYSIYGQAPPKARRIVTYKDIQPGHLLKMLFTSLGFDTNGTYDKLPFGFGLGIRHDMINNQDLEFAATLLDRFGPRTGVIKERVTLLDIIKAELKLPVGVILKTDNQGRISLSVSGIPTSTMSADFKTITDDDIIFNSRMEQAFNRDSIINKVSLLCDYNYVDGKFKSTIMAVEPNSVQKYGEKELKIEHKGIRTRSILGNAGSYASGDIYSTFSSLCRSLFERRAWESPTISIKTSPTTVKLQPTDPVLITISDMQDHCNSSATGISAVGAEVLSVERSAVTGECKITLRRSRGVDKYGGWSPSAKIVSVDTSNTAVGIEGNLYTFSNPPSFMPWLKDRDYKFFDTDDELIAMEAGKRLPVMVRCSVVDASSQDIITLNTVSSITTGMILIPAQYSIQPSTQTSDEFVILARTNGYIGDSESPFRYRV